MNTSRKVSVLFLMSIASVLFLLANDSPVVSKSFADIEKAKTESDCLKDTIPNPCNASRKDVACLSGSFFCGPEESVDYTAKVCTSVPGSANQCFTETLQPCGTIKNCSDGSDVLENSMTVPCNSKYKKCVAFDAP